MGNKAGYSAVVLAALGLRSGQGAGAYLWAEADPDVAALLRTYPDAQMLRRVAEIIRGWAGEEPRALWERLRAERKARGARGGADGASEWMMVQSGAWGTAPVFGTPEGWRYVGGVTADGSCPGRPVVPSFKGPEAQSAAGMADACDRLAEARDVAGTVIEHRWSFSEKGPSHGYGGPGCDGGQWDMASRDKALGCDRTAERVEQMADDIANRSLLGQWSYRRGDPDSGVNAGLLTDRGPNENGGHGAKARTVEQEAGGFERLAGEVAGWAFVTGNAYAGGDGWKPVPTARPNTGANLSADGLAASVAAVASGWPPVLVLPRIPEPADVAAWLGTPGDLEGVVVYKDWPYQNTTGYQHDLPRAEGVRFALAYAAMGAVVCCSEAEAIPELMAAGWFAAEITAGRKGQKRTFSKQQGEWLTMNREPAHRVATQSALVTVAEVPRAVVEKVERPTAPKPEAPAVVQGSLFAQPTGARE